MSDRIEAETELHPIIEISEIEMSEFELVQTEQEKEEELEKLRSENQRLKLEVRYMRRSQDVAPVCPEYKTYNNWLEAAIHKGLDFIGW